MKLESMTFEEIYLIFVNDFLTIEKMAEYYNIDKDLLTHWIDCGRFTNQYEEDWEELQNKINELYLNLI
jgi:hypothetical protein